MRLYLRHIKKGYEDMMQQGPPLVLTCCILNPSPSVCLSNAANERSAHGQAFVDRFRFNAKRAALVQSRIKAIERLADVETIASDPGRP